jgi:RNA polymerase sigma-70 factor (ECF subfamily)
MAMSVRSEPATVGELEADPS